MLVIRKSGAAERTKGARLSYDSRNEGKIHICCLRRRTWYDVYSVFQYIHRIIRLRPEMWQNRNQTTLLALFLFVCIYAGQTCRLLLNASRYRCRRASARLPRLHTPIQHANNRCCWPAEAIARARENNSTNQKMVHLYLMDPIFFKFNLKFVIKLLYGTAS